MCGLGMGELLIILLIVVLLFGASKLPQLGKALGETMRNFKKSSASAEAEKKPEPIEVHEVGKLVEGGDAPAPAPTPAKVEAPVAEKADKPS
jgi:sec-independent protein translocase protein TatA